jgi:hypothetical protein
VQPCDDYEVFSAFSLQWSTGETKLKGENWSTQRKTCPSATLSTTNPTWTDPVSNLRFCGERPATDRLSHGTAKAWFPTGRRTQMNTRPDNAQRLALRYKCVNTSLKSTNQVTRPEYGACSFLLETDIFLPDYTESYSSIRYTSRSPPDSLHWQPSRLSCCRSL